MWDDIPPLLGLVLRNFERDKQVHSDYLGVAGVVVGHEEYDRVVAVGVHNEPVGDCNHTQAAEGLGDVGFAEALYHTLLAVEGISRRPTLRRPRPRSLTWPAGRLRSTRFADLGIAETR